jgi:hypothetical protein
LISSLRRIPLIGCIGVTASAEPARPAQVYLPQYHLTSRKPRYARIGRGARTAKDYWRKRRLLRKNRARQRDSYRILMQLFTWLIAKRDIGTWGRA